jgi:YegS/Rv2252/BmrU family lipid kinase
VNPESQKHIALLCNTHAGAGLAKEMAGRISVILQAENIRHQTIFNPWPVSFESYTDLWVVGGDGTLHYFINAYPGITLPLGIFPGGTGNDFHWQLYGTKSLEEQVNCMLQAVPVPIDIGQCNHRFFINGVGIGFEGEVARALSGKTKWPGKTSFLLAVLKKIFSYRSKSYTIQSEESFFTHRKLLIDISNGRRAGGGFHIAPQALANDGLLDVVMADALNPLRRLRYLPVIERGKHLGLSVFQHFRTKTILVTSEHIIQYHLDGEYAEAEQLDIKIREGRLLFCY